MTISTMRSRQRQRRFVTDEVVDRFCIVGPSTTTAKNSTPPQSRVTQFNVYLMSATKKNPRRLPPQNLAALH